MTAYDPNNIFAKILRGEIPCDKIHENEYAIAFNDIGPKAPVHVLVVPKGAYVSITDFSQNASAAEIAGFFRAVGAVIEMLGVDSEGFRSIANTGLNGGQEVPHFHMHILAGKSLGPMVQAKAA